MATLDAAEATSQSFCFANDFNQSCSAADYIVKQSKVILETFQLGINGLKSSDQLLVLLRSYAPYQK
jgi:hypothetical protein